MPEQRVFEVDKLSKNDRLTLEGRTWIYLGRSEKDAFFISTRAKYTCYCRIANGRTDLYDLSRMDTTREELERAHGF